MNTKVRWPAAILTACLLVVLPASAQDDDEPTSVFVETVTVEIVNLDVVVTDESGEPVTGLTREDFELSIDGEPTEIQNFYVVEPEPGAAVGETEPDAATTAEAVDAPADSTVPREQQLHVVVLVDGRHATPGERKRVTRDLAAAFAEGLGGPGRQVAVMVYDGGIKVRQPFTRDGAKIASVLTELGSEGVTGLQDELDRRELLRELENTPPDGDNARIILGRIEAYAEQQVRDLELTLGSLERLIDSLGGLPGRKSLLYVASGLPIQPGAELFAAWRNKFADVEGAVGLTGPSELAVTTGNLDPSTRLRNLTLRSNANRVAFYAIGTAGAGVTSAVSAERSGFDPAAIDTPGGGRVWDAAMDARFQANMGAGLEQVAAITGGDALTGSGNYDLMAERIQTDAEYSYSLGFRAPEGDPGQSHRVELSVPGKDLRLRYRREYVTETPAQQAADTTLAALLWETEHNPIGVAVDFGPPQPSEKGKQLVQPILVKVPFVNLVMVPEERFHRGQLTIFVTAEDEQGRVAPVQTIEAPIRIPNDQMVDALRGVGGYRVGLLMRPGPHNVAVGVRDEIGNVVSTVRLEHDVRPTGAS